MLIELVLIMSLNEWDIKFAGESSFQGEEKPSITTILTPEEATKAMAEGYRQVTGRWPTKKVLGLMVGQWALETGNGRAMRNYNFGNKKASGNEDYQYFSCSEVIGGQEFHYTGKHPACRFASYRSAPEGAKAFVELLKRRDHWWKGLHTGDVNGFIAGLTTPPAYFTASPSKYAYALNNRMESYQEYVNKYGRSNFTQLFVGMAFGLAVWWSYKDLQKSKSIIRTHANDLAKGFAK